MKYLDDILINFNRKEIKSSIINWFFKIQNII